MRKIVLVTGAGKGLGKVIAQSLVKHGYKVYGTYMSSDTSMTTGVIYQKLDITSDSSCNRVIKEIIEKDKKIDVLINCVGLTLSGRITEFSSSDFKRILDVNVVGAFRLSKEILPYKPKLIVNVSSLSGFLSLPYFGLYSASKFALSALGDSLYYELYPQTRIVTVFPGALQNENSIKSMKHKPVREKYPLINSLMPLTKMTDVAEEIFNLVICLARLRRRL